MRGGFVGSPTVMEGEHLGIGVFPTMPASWNLPIPLFFFNGSIASYHATGSASGRIW